MDTLIIFLKAHVKAHTRRLASGKVVHVGAYTTKAPSAGTGERVGIHLARSAELLIALVAVLLPGVRLRWLTLPPSIAGNKICDHTVPGVSVMRKHLLALALAATCGVASGCGGACKRSPACTARPVATAWRVPGRRVSGRPSRPGGPATTFTRQRSTKPPASEPITLQRTSTWTRPAAA